MFAKGLGHRGLDLSGRAEAEATVHTFLDRRDDFWMGMAHDHRAPRTDVVDITALVRVNEVGALPAPEEQRGAADALECPDRGIDPARDHALGTAE